ncbi:MAG: FAD-dependent oxidoreductase [Myxococcota bacterium]
MSRVVVPSFLRLIRAIRAARAGGPSALERLEQAAVARRDRGPSRRAVVAGLGALAACRPSEPLPTPTPSSTGLTGEPRVVVLGAGLAGLACVHQLALAGVRAELYEARDRVGGRVITGRGVFPSLPAATIELGAEWVNSADAALLGLVDALGLTLHDSWDEFDLETLIWLDGRRVSLRSLAPELARITAACDAGLAGLTDHGAAISYANPSGAEALDRMSAADWLDAVDASADARALVGLVALADYGRELDDQSALNVLSLFETGADDTYDERYLIAGGNDQVATGLAALYADRLHLGAELVALTGIAGPTDAPTGWSLSFADGTEERADIVVCTLPFTVLRGIPLDAALSPVKRACLDTLGYGTNAKLVVPYGRRFWRDAGDSGLAITEAFQEGWDATMVQGLDAGAFATFRGGDAGLAVGAGSTADRGQELVATLDVLWPGSAALVSGDAIRATWADDPWVGGSYSCYRVGQWTGIGGAEGEPVGTLLFAGEHTSYVFQGYMNGAAQSGVDAAADVLALRSGTRRRRPPPRAGRRRARS